MSLRICCIYATIFLCALAVRYSYSYSLQHDYADLANDEVVYDQLARTLLAEGTFIRNGEDSNRPPLYPLFVAAIYGCTHQSLHAVIVAQCILGAFTCVLIAATAAWMTRSRRWAAAAGGIAVSYYGLLEMPASLLTETLVTFWLTLGIWLLIKNRRSAIRALLGGMVLGLAALTRSNFLLLPLLAGGWQALRDRRLAPGLLVITGCCLVVGPWTLRNAAVHQQLIPVNIQTGIVFWGAHNPLAQGGWVDPKTVSPAAAQRVRAYGALPLPERNRQYVREGLAYLQKRSGMQLLQLIGQKCYWLLFPSIGVYDVTFVLLAPFMVAGIARQATQREILVWVLVTGLLTTLVFYGSPRFRGPLSPALIVLAVLGLRDYSRRHATRRRTALIGLWAAGNALLFYLEAWVAYDFQLF